MSIIQKINIASAPQTVWEVLMQRMSFPEDFQPDIIEKSFPLENENEFIRRVETEHGGVTEQFLLDEPNKTLKINLIKHPYFSGSSVFSINQIENQTELIIEYNWVSKAKEDFTDMLPKAISNLAEIIKNTAEADEELADEDNDFYEDEDEEADEEK
jgi:hypothetical protein